MPVDKAKQALWWAKYPRGLYQAMQEAGVEIDSHESDLYVKETPAADAVIEEAMRHDSAPCFTRFRSSVDGSVWLDFPFMFVPWWESRAR